MCLFKSSKGRIFGGYSDKSWFNDLQFKASKDAFLFSLHYKKKMNLYRNQNKALLFSKQNGPCFGEDLIIGDECNVK